jgi:hypothetical protein
MAGESLDQRTNLCYIQSPAVREYYNKITRTVKAAKKRKTKSSQAYIIGSTATVAITKPNTVITANIISVVFLVFIIKVPFFWVNIWIAAIK